MRIAFVSAALLVAACTGDLAPDAKTGTAPSTGQSGRAFSADASGFADGPVPWLGTSNLAVQGGAITLAPTATIGQAIVPYAIRPRMLEGYGFDTTITVDAEVPVGAQLIVGRGRLRDNANQAGVGVIVAPSASTTAPTSFLVALGLGTFAGSTAPLACAGTPLGRSTLLIPTPAGTSAVTGITSPDLGRQTVMMPEAPQLALLSNTLTGGHGSSALVPTRQLLSFTFKKTGDGIGTVAAAQGTTTMFAPTAIDAATMNGHSLACKLSWATCEGICASDLNALFVFGEACAPQACRDGLTARADGRLNPEPGDFSGAETCRQSSPCNTEAAAGSAVSLTAKTAIREVFRNAAVSNEILFQFVRSRSGLAPRIYSISIDR